MISYQNTPQDFTTLRNRVIFKRLPILFIAVIIGTGATLLTNKNVSTNASAYVILLMVVLGVFIYNTVKTIKQEKEIYKSYKLTIDADHLSRQQNGLPVANLFFNDISQIVETRQGNLIVKGQPGKYIVVPATIESYEIAKGILGSIKPITQSTPKKSHQILLMLTPLVCVSLMAGVYISNNKIIVSFSGIILTVLLTWSFYKIKTNKFLDSRLKRPLWFMPIVLLSIITIVYYKVFVK
jgi:hypothetical protein